MTSLSTQASSMRSRVLTGFATLALAAGASAIVAGPAGAATAECGFNCISVFSSELGNHDDPNFVEAVLDGGAANIGQPVGLKAANPFDPSQDIQPVLSSVSGFHAQGIVSDEANAKYGTRTAVQQKYAPYGVPVQPELCVGLESGNRQNEGLTLQPCDAASTVWIIDAYPATKDGYFPIINATTTDYVRPFAMHLPRGAVRSGKPIQMRARHLQFLGEENTLPARQLWAAWSGPLKQDQ